MLLMNLVDECVWGSRLLAVGRSKRTFDRQNLGLAVDF